MAATTPLGINRKPGEMETWELITAYRHAYALAGFHPSAQLAKALSGWLFAARNVLETRGRYDPSYLHS